MYSGFSVPPQAELTPVTSGLIAAPVAAGLISSTEESMLTKVLLVFHYLSCPGYDIKLLSCPGYDIFIHVLAMT